MTSNDLEVIEEIEEALGVQLPRVEDLLFERGYVLDENNHVVALSLTRSGLMETSVAFSFLKDLKKLRRLNLSSNHFSNYSFLKPLYQLQVLDLSFNQIDDCSFLNDLIQLQELDLHSNKISNCSFFKNLASYACLI